MKITLVQSGGFLPVTKQASAEVDWTEDECTHLLKQIAVPVSEPPAVVRDGIDHTVEIDGKATQVNIDKASGKYAAEINKLKSKLQIVKT